MVLSPFLLLQIAQNPTQPLTKDVGEDPRVRVSKVPKFLPALCDAGKKLKPIWRPHCRSQMESLTGREAPWAVGASVPSLDSVFGHLNGCGVPKCGLELASSFWRF